MNHPRAGAHRAGAPTERTAFLGSFVPLPRTAAEAAAAHDPRIAVESRYKSYDDYRAQFQRALDELVRERYLLAEDSAQLTNRSQEEWKWVAQVENLLLFSVFEPARFFGQPVRGLAVMSFSGVSVSG